jgi:hypothetical protein
MDKKFKPDISQVASEEPLTGCVVCGLYSGDLPETAGKARWHKACGESRPDVIKKVKARA